MQICEVGPRDGLQNEKRAWSVDERIALINRLADTGLKRIEAVSFVNPKRVPQMAGAEDVAAGIDRRPGVIYSALALNSRGVERALKAGMDEIRCVVVASETFSRKNSGATPAEVVAGFAEVAADVKTSGTRLSLGIAAAFGCPFEGIIPAEQVLQLADRLLALEPDEIWLADTIGAGVPSEVQTLIEALVRRVDGKTSVGAHFHNTRNTGYANAFAAMISGATFLDSSIGGLGGCPFAPKATGNIATEDLCYMLRNMKIETGIDLAGLTDTASWAEEVLGRPVPGLVVKAGLFPEVTRSAGETG